MRKLVFICLMVTSFSSGVLAGPSDQWKQNVVKKQEMKLKQKIVGAVILASTMYMFREDLEDISFRHNKWAYGAMLFGITEIFGWKLALGFMLGREVTQLETWPELLSDSATDILAGSLGIIISIKL